ncbi:MAG: DUF502 domain-containing protein [Pseudomonadota bacterium]
MKRYLITGLLIWVPIAVTFLILKLLVDLMDQTLVLIPPKYRDFEMFGITVFEIPGLGVVLTLVLLLVTGLIAANFLGRRIVAFGESLLVRVPFVSSIYSSAKQVAETLLADNGESFKKVLLVEYPRKGLWSLGFQTSSDLKEIQTLSTEPRVCVFIPTTPNPTSGFIIMVPTTQVRALSMSVDDALKMIISLGVVVPTHDPDGLIEQQKAENPS